MGATNFQDLVFMVYNTCMYGYGRAYRSKMGLVQLFTSKNYKKSNFEDINIEKYVLFGKTIFLLWENMNCYI
jgi:hypothetical protein